MRSGLIKAIKICTLILVISSIAVASWLKDYMIHNQLAWAGRVDLIEVRFVAPDLIAPKPIGYLYYGVSLLFIASVSCVPFLWKKRRSVNKLPEDWDA